MEGAADRQRGKRVRRRGEDRPRAHVDMKTLHAKIAELTLENDFLEGKLIEVGLLGAKRSQ